MVKSNGRLNFVYLHQVLEELKKSNFTLLNQSIHFDENGDPKFGSYSIVFWNHNGNAEEIGFYNFHSAVNFFIDSPKIQWYTQGDVSCFSFKCVGRGKITTSKKYERKFMEKVECISSSCLDV